MSDPGELRINVNGVWTWGHDQLRIRFVSVDEKNAFLGALNNMGMAIAVKAVE